jgi:hypothetical protein
MYSRIVWEGWTIQDFIDDLESQIDLIMLGESWLQPFRTRKELEEYTKDNQPYYKKTIPELNSYFARRYGLE